MAKKPSVTTVASGYQATDTINTNFTNVRNSFDNTISRDGSVPNAMEADLDIGDNNLINVNTLYTDEVIINGLSLKGILTGAYSLLYPGLGLDFTDNSSTVVSTDPTADGDKGDITVSNGGTVWTIDSGVVNIAKLGGDITSAGKALLDDADAAAQRVTLGLGTAATNASSDFATAVHTHSATDITSGTLPITRGGTGLTGTPTTGQLLIGNGTNYTLARLTAGPNVTITNGAGSIQISASSGGGSGNLVDADYGDIIVSGGATVMTIDSGVVNTSKLGGDITTAGKALLDDADASAQRTTLGLGTVATQAANNVNITGGTIAGITDLAIADGGTGASTAANARTNLGLGTVATLNVGTSANNVVQLDGSARLPAVDGSQLTNLPVSSALPTGSVMPYAGATAPSGWLLCFGQTVSRTTNATLFAVIGTTYGAGDGSTTFGIPDLRGRVIAGQDDMGGTSANRLTGLSGGVDGDVLGGVGGAETNTLTTAQIPSHQHFVARAAAGTSALSSTNTLNEEAGYGSNASYTLAGGTGAASIGLSSSTGSGSAHNNVQPTIILNYIIKV